MRKLFQNRYFIIGVAFSLLFATLLLSLFDLQFRQGDVYAQESESGLERDLRITGNRGTIMDSTGVPLAYDQNSFQVVFYKDSSRRLGSYFDPEGTELRRTNADMYTEVMRRTIAIIEQNSGSVIQTFNIRHNDEGIPYFEFSTTNEKIQQVRLERWLKNMAVSTKYYTAGDEFFTDLRKRYNEDPDIEINKDTTDGQLLSIFAGEIYEYLRNRYKIPADVSYEEAFKVLSIWQEAQLASYRTYVPVIVADDVNMDTVAAIEMQKMHLEGMEIRENNIRIYPKNELAAHIVGYMGRMLDESTIMDKVEIGYTREDLVGISGIEATMEGELTPNLSSRTGVRKVEVNSKGKIISEKSVIPPIDGNDVVLTIDIKMQKKLEDTLEQNIKEVRSYQEQEYLSNYDKYEAQMKLQKRTTPIQMAEVGAAVVMQVQSGAILAMASYPSFDPNIFTGGLTNEEYATMKDDTRNPLFNKAIASRAAPGSIFKMVTGVAGLMEEEITLDEIINDEGPWTKDIESGKQPSCWIRPNYHLHTNQDFAEALKNSCNYYFFTVADRIGIENLNKWADLFGLSSETNVELLGENAGQVANELTLYDPSKPPSGTSKVVYNAIRNILVNKCKELNLEFEDEVFDNATLQLMALAQIEEPGPDIRGILKNEFGFSTYDILNVPYQRIDGAISQNLLELDWSPVDTILTGIGQSVTLLTPIAVARYIAALVNGGNVYDARLVKSIVSPDGQTIEEKRPQLIRTLDIPLSFTEAVKLGMKDVVRDEHGTAQKYFSGFKYIDDIGGKTGTAQVSQIDLENNAWFVAFAPYEQPEIAIAVYIKNGYSGGKAAYTAKEMVEFYLDRKEIKATAPTVPDSNDLTP
jgi:penicillin-binding protein 2